MGALNTGTPLTVELLSPATISDMAGCDRTLGIYPGGLNLLGRTFLSRTTLYAYTIRKSYSRSILLTTYTNYFENRLSSIVVSSGLDAHVVMAASVRAFVAVVSLAMCFLSLQIAFLRPWIMWRLIPAGMQKWTPVNTTNKEFKKGSLLQT